MSDFNTSAFGPYTACTPLSFTISPKAPFCFHCASGATTSKSFTVTRQRVIQASTSAIFSFPPNKSITFVANEPSCTFPVPSDASSSLSI